MSASLTYAVDKIGQTNNWEWRGVAGWSYGQVRRFDDEGGMKTYTHGHSPRQAEFLTPPSTTLMDRQSGGGGGDKMFRGRETAIQETREGESR